MTGANETEEDSMAYKLTREALLLDLYAAFTCASRHKTKKSYVCRFRRDLRINLEQLADELLSHTYRPEPSSCFIVDYPKKREVFAAQFRDRVVHHLYYNYTHRLFERTFISDSYSCIEGRGTHYGIERLKKHILQESHSHQRKCYVLKLDIRGYFMHIVRSKLLAIACETLERMRSHRIDKDGRQTWDDVIDIGFVKWLTERIVMENPKNNCRIVGDPERWNGLDKSKSLFYAPDGCGLPIGNLTSQLFSNVYMNVFDQFMKRKLHCLHYGRYVDDSYIVSHDRQWLLSLVSQARDFLHDELGLDLHMGKVQVADSKWGVEFTGAYVKPWRCYISNASLQRILQTVAEMRTDNPMAVYRSVNSLLGILAHYDSYNIRSEIFCRKKLLSVSTYNSNITKMYKPYFSQAA